jgi:protein involved in polysaccharide export with SLBB domain
LVSGLNHFLCIQSLTQVMKRIFAALFFCCLAATSFGQQLLSQDLRSVQADAISDSELKSYYDKAKAQNLSDTQIGEVLISKGLAPTELSKLQARIKSLQVGASSISANRATAAGTETRTTVSSGDETISIKLDPFESQIYGMELFTTPSLSFEPNLRLATPPNYVLGPDDQLQINVFGYSEAQYRLIVSPEGTINIPNVGPIYVNGLTITAAKSKISQKLASTIYRAISSGQTQVSVTLANVRSIKVVVVGQARKPGTYTVSSFSTLFNLLYLCGGPSKEGSYRFIEVIRAGSIIKTVDLYTFLHGGDISSNISLQDNDVIRIPYYAKRIKLTGEFKRPAYFELKANEALSRAIEYAGSFSDSAYRLQVRIFQVGGKERKIAVLNQEQYSSYTPNTGDEVVAEKISSRFENRVIVAGAINRPGQYDFSNGMTVKALLQRADGIKEDAFTARASISRLKDDLTRELIAFDVKALMAGTFDDIRLQREDIITIPSLYELRDNQIISVEGEVRRAGVIPFKAGMTIKDAILESGGFTDAATGKRLEIGRRIINAEDGKENMQVAEVVVVDTEKDLSLSSNTVQLQPNDIIVIRNNPGYYVQKSIVVDGEVKYTGKYIIAEKNERLSDLIMRAGGVTSLADASAASLERVNKNYVKDTTYKSGTLSKLGFDSTDNLQVFKKVEKIGINLGAIMKAPHSSIDIILEDGDVITVPKRDAIVKVRGQVLVPSQLSYIEGVNLKFYISRAGGFTQKAIKRKTFVLSANGNAKRTKSFLFFRSYPVVNAGDEIYVPEEAVKTGKGLTTGELIGITTALASLTSILLAIFK